MVAGKGGQQIFISCEEAGCIEVFNTERETVTARYDVPGVNRLALAPSSDRLYATAGMVTGVIHEIDIASGKTLRTFSAGHSPESLLVSADGKTLFYCNRFSRADQSDVHALDLASGKVVHSAKALREPASLALSRDGRTLWVANFLPVMPANSQHVYAELNLYDTTTLEKVSTLNLPSGAFAIRNSVMSADGKYYFVTHSIGRFTVPTTHLDRGWINTGAVSIFDVEKRAYINSVLLDDTVLGAANPWGLAIVGKDEWLCVGISGTHELIAVNIKEMMKRLHETPKPLEVVNDLSFLYGAKIRVPMEGYGPRWLVACGSQVYSSMYFSDRLNCVEIWEDGPGAAVPLPLSPVAAQPDLVRLGELAFHDATFCYQHWLSCASCHPDARTDGTNWDLMNDGIGNPKQSRSMLYSHRTSPVMITGVRASAEIAVAKGFAMIQFHELPEERLESVDAYLKTLKPVPSPYLKPDGTLTAAALRGKKLFDGKAGCVACHTPPYHSDKKKYVLNLGSDVERDRPFVTPILIEIWRTAPYMYDGRVSTIEEVITTDNSNNKHGNTRDLKPEEVKDLAEYVNSL